MKIHGGWITLTKYRSPRDIHPQSLTIKEKKYYIMSFVAINPKYFIIIDNNTSYDKRVFQSQICNL